MDSYIQRWNDLILNCNFDNTYKIAWAKSLVELAVDTNLPKDDVIVFDFNDIATLCLKYYWNQTIYFDLIQGSNIKKPPAIVTLTKELIALFFDKRKSVQPIRFEKADFNAWGLGRNYHTTVQKIAKTLKQDVCWRFKKLNKQTYEVYDLNRDEGKVSFSKGDILLLKQYSDLMFPVINYRWTQMLEGFNYSPRISRKVRAIDANNIKRASLKKFHKHLDLMFDDGIQNCFYCGEKIEEDQISVDHVIPWSYMFSGDLWNLVYCHKGENSEKSNRLPSEEDITRLEERNIQLLQRIPNRTKDYDQLQIAVEKDYVKKFWISFKG